MGSVIHGGKGSFTHVENTVFFDRELSLKAKGIYCQIRSLKGNPEWVFTIRGFASLVKDGVDSVSAGIKELESAGYVIRARRRGEAGRFLKAEEATWITLDDPAMHDAVAEKLRSEGFAILSEFARKDRAPKAREAAEEGDGSGKAQVVPRTGKSVSGPATSGKARSGEPGAINYSWDKAPESNQLPLPPRGKPGTKGKAAASSPTGEASSLRSSRGSARCRSSPSPPSGSRGPASPLGRRGSPRDTCRARSLTPTPHTPRATAGATATTAGWQRTWRGDSRATTACPCGRTTPYPPTPWDATGSLSTWRASRRRTRGSRGPGAGSRRGAT